jgi:hypothetical protein
LPVLKRLFTRNNGSGEKINKNIFFSAERMNAEAAIRGKSRKKVSQN